MFQTFEDSADPTVGPPRLARLRQELSRRGVDGFLVPRTDEHQNEYVPTHAERLRWLTGFTGSWGTAVCLRDKAALVVDGRYTLQAAQQVDTAAFDIVFSGDTSAEAWLEQTMPPGGVIGVDPWLHTADNLRRIEAAVAARGGRVVHVDGNPIDAVWDDRPAPPVGRITVQPLAFAGEDVTEKVARVRAAIAKAGADVMAITDPQAVAWLFNIRGADVTHTPVPLAYATLAADGSAHLYVDQRKFSNESRDHVARHAGIAPYEAFREALSALGRQGARVLVDPQSAPSAVAHLVTAGGGTAVAATDPIIIMRARKNAAEQDGARAAHRRDGAAMARFLAWFARTAPAGHLTEIDVASALEGFRRETGALEEISFPSISGSGPNGAIVHYRVTQATNRPVERDQLFLIDSGGQYRDGTTDVTRTLVVGTPTDEMRARFTDVLRGMIAISTARFPKGTSGAHLDALARIALWRGGFDYDHGTGHGVGSFLSVHEGPCRIAKVASPPIEPGIILSNEPGYYKTGAFGIRIENLILVTEPAVPAGGERPMMAFETLTLVPIERALIATDRLTADERTWVDAYHARVLQEIGPLVDADTRRFLEQACAPL